MQEGMGRAFNAGAVNGQHKAYQLTAGMPICAISVMSAICELRQADQCWMRALKLQRCFACYARHLTHRGPHWRQGLVQLLLQRQSVLADEVLGRINTKAWC